MRKLWALLKDREWVIVAILAVGVVLWATWQREEIFTAVDAAVLVLIACTVSLCFASWSLLLAACNTEF